ncbi:MAG: NUDIX hydrolase [Chloroflexi bacterium]|nr:NUDIX hydrolase [Chloroflexota bacterium]
MADSREYPTRPIPGVGVIVRKDDLVLMIQRGKAPGYGMWGLPGGAIELGEALRDAAAREVREECGIEIALGDVVDAVDIVLRDDAGRAQYHYVIVDFFARYVSGDVRAGDDVLDARWVARADLIKFDVPKMTRQVIAKAWTREGSK